MGRSDRKIELILQAHEASQLLKALAATLGHAVSPEALQALAPQVEASSALKLTVKRQGGIAEVGLKLKATGQATGESGGTPRPESFKAVKKRMKTVFKFLQHCQDSSLLPPEALVEAFLRDSLAMCSHPGRGEQDYGPHLALCNDLKTAFDQKDREAFGVILQELEAAKKDCHAEAK